MMTVFQENSATESEKSEIITDSCFDGVEQQKKKIDRAKKEVELARIKLNEVMIDRKTHEKLKERAFDEFKQELSDTEAKEVDEIVSFNFNKSE